MLPQNVVLSWLASRNNLRNRQQNDIFFETISQSKHIYAFSVSIRVNRKIRDDEGKIFHLCDNHVWSSGRESVAPIRRCCSCFCDLHFSSPNRDGWVALDNSFFFCLLVIEERMFEAERGPINTFTWKVPSREGWVPCCTRNKTAALPPCYFAFE